MEDLRFNKSLKNYDDDPSRCIICLSKVSQKLSDDCRKKGEGDDRRSEEETLQKMAPKSVVKAPGFLTTFNRIWESLHKCKSGSSEEMVLESLITEEGSLKAAFSKAPTFCKLCCQKIVAVENLLKAVKRQVGEIKLILEESRRRDKEGKESTQISSEEDQSADEVKDEDDGDVNEKDWEWEDSNVALTEQSPPQQSPILPIVEEPCNSIAMEGDDANVQLTLDGEGDDGGGIGGATEDGEEVEEDDSNWAWDDDDPDYIKSEEDDNVNDDYEYDEDYSSEEHEEPLSVKDKLGNTEEKDPLEIPASSSKSRSLANQQNFFGIIISCDVKGCGRTFKAVSGLQKHRKLCHPSPIQQKLNLEKLKKAHSAKSSSSSSPFKVFSCDLEACSRKVGSKESLFIHQKQCHLEMMIALGRIKVDPSKNKFPCSCGQSFPSQATRYKHQCKSKLKHPEFQYKLRELRSQLENGQMCDLCNEPVKLSDILEHLTDHLGGRAEYVVKCPNFVHCGHMFTHSKRLHEGHLKSVRFSSSCRKVSDEKKFDLSCETCDYTTDKRISLTAHVANEHERGTLPRNLSCPISSCRKLFATRQGIYFHLHAHRYKKITTQVCKFCLETIKIEGLEEHFKGKHGILEIFGCKLCPVKFSERDELLDHLWDHRHSGLSCDICGDDKEDKFVRYSDLREHYIGVHKLCPRKFQCEKCPSAFWRKPDLYKHHVENHKHNAGAVKRREATFKCDLCFENNSFPREISLISHKIRVHGEIGRAHV